MAGFSTETHTLVSGLKEKSGSVRSGLETRILLAGICCQLFDCCFPFSTVFSLLVLLPSFFVGEMNLYIVSMR